MIRLDRLSLPALALLPLLACTPAPQPIPAPTLPVVPSCDCDAPETDAGSVARTGFPLGVVWSEHAQILSEGQVQRQVQFVLDKVTMAQIGAAPAKVCRFHGQDLVSYSVHQPGPGDRDLPDTMVLEVLCQS